MNTGEKNLQRLLQTMKPHLNEGDYVFCTAKHVEAAVQQQAIMVFREAEGPTFLLPKAVADERNLAYSFVAAWITLTVHSALDAVGLTSAFATALAKEHISCNVAAGFYHDHLFVPKQAAEKAMAALQHLAITP